jgi:hypothetical protein
MLRALRACGEARVLEQRRGVRLSPGVRQLLTELEAHMLAVAGDFDRSR